MRSSSDSNNEQTSGAAPVSPRSRLSHFRNPTTVSRVGICLLVSAGVVLVVSWIACFVIQDVLPPGYLTDIVGFVVYLGGPLPVLPAVLGASGVVALLFGS